MSATILVVMGLGLVPSGPLKLPNGPDEQVVVFRYPAPRLGPFRELESNDIRQIWRTIKDLEIGYRADTHGNGTVVRISLKDLGRWKRAVDKLIEDGVLQYYRWGTDMEGYGLVPVW